MRILYSQELLLKWKWTYATNNWNWGGSETSVDLAIFRVVGTKFKDYLYLKL